LRKGKTQRVNLSRGPLGRFHCDSWNLAGFTVIPGIWQVFCDSWNLARFCRFRPFLRDTLLFSSTSKMGKRKPMVPMTDDGFALLSLTIFRCDCAHRGDVLTVQAVTIPY
jgi:hypothetical protein